MLQKNRGRCKALTILRGQLLRARHKLSDTNVIHKLSRATGVGRKAPTKNGPDISVAARLNNTLLQTAHGFQGLDIEQPVANVFSGYALARTHEGFEAFPQVLFLALRIVVKAAPVGTSHALIAM
jgi:hypothetical protein